MVENNDKYKIEYLSSVSGGGYLASSYMHFRSTCLKNSQTDSLEKQREKLKNFLTNFRNNVGYLLDLSTFYAPFWSASFNSLGTPIRFASILWKFVQTIINFFSLLESIISALIFGIVFVLLFILSTMPPAFPLAQGIKYLYTSLGLNWIWTIWGSLLVIAIVVFCLKYLLVLALNCTSPPHRTSNTKKPYWNRTMILTALIDTLSGLDTFLFAGGCIVFYVFLEDLIGIEIWDELTTWILGGIFLTARFTLPKISVWVLGKVSEYVKTQFFELMILVVVYCRVACFYVLEQTFLGIAFNETVWYWTWIGSMIAFALHPVWGYCRHSLVFNYYKWRLQRAFYAFDGKNSWISRHLNSLLGWLPINASFGGRNTTFRDIGRAKAQDDSIPTFVCNMTVNGWKTIIQDSNYRDAEFLKTIIKNSYHYDIISIESNHQDDCNPKYYRYTLGNLSEKPITGKIEVEYPLSEAMTTSAAALTERLGKYEDKAKKVKLTPGLISLAGIGISKWSYYYNLKNNWMFRCSVIISIILLILQVSLSIGGIFYRPLGVAVLLGIVLLLIFHPLMDIITGKIGDNWHGLLNMYPPIRIYRSMMSMDTYRGSLPVDANLSDGGHTENLAAFHLLAKQHENIIIVDAGEDPHTEFSDLLFLLKIARETLSCKFYKDKEDLERYLLRKVIKDSHLGCFSFEVEYTYFENGAPKKKMGNIVYIKPRAQAPSKSNWNLYTPCFLWCGVFPHNITLNQFFTVGMFDQYHNEGYRLAKQMEQTGIELRDISGVAEESSSLENEQQPSIQTEQESNV